MDFTQYDGKSWFEDIKKSRSEFFNVDNIIELAKWKFNVEWDSLKWAVSIGLTLLFSSGVFNLFKDANISPTVARIASGVFIFGLLEIFIVIIIGIFILNRRKIIMAYLYREKDTQEKIKALGKKPKRNVKIKIQKGQIDFTN